MGLAQVFGPDRVAVGLVEELLVKGTTARGGAGGPVDGVCPTGVGSDDGDEVAFGAGRCVGRGSVRRGHA